MVPTNLVEAKAEGGVRPAASPEYHLTAQSIASLDRFEGSPLLAQGRLCLIGLDAIVERFADRWPGRRDQVYDMVERTMERRLDEDAVVMRVSERDYLVAQPSRERAAAQALCLRSLREILEHFLGKSSIGQLKIYEVSELSRSGIYAAPVDPRAVLQITPERPAEARSWRPPGDVESVPATSSLAATLSATLSDGVAVRIEPSIEPLFCLKTGRYIGHRIVRSVRNVRRGEVMPDRDVERLARCDVERIDLATITLGLEQIERANRPRELVLMVPVSFANLASHRGNPAVAAALERARKHVKQGVLCEVLDLDGAPLATLSESLAMIRRVCILTIARLADPLGPQTGGLRQLGFDGVSLASPQPVENDAQFVEWAKQALPAARRGARSVMVHGAGSVRRLLIAAAHGATHAGVPEDLRRGLVERLDGGVLDG
jgi:hypothetical protein